MKTTCQFSTSSDRTAPRLALLAALAFPLFAGCRLPGTDGPASRSLVTCRQLSQQGQVALDRGDWRQAEELLSKAVASCPVDTESRRHYADALWKGGNQAEALAQMDEAVRLSRDDAKLLVRSAEMRLALGQTVEAGRQVEQAIDLDPQSAEAWALRGRVRCHAGLMREGLADYYRALSYATEPRDLLLDIAEVHRQLGEPHRALSNLLTLAETYPPGDEPPQVLYLLGLAYSALGRYPDAIESLVAARDRGDPSPEILYRLADAELRNGQHTEARQTIEQALRIKPEHAGGRQLLARLDGAPDSGARTR